MKHAVGVVVATSFDSLLISTPIVGFCNCSMFYCVLLCVHSSFAIISMGKKEQIALLCLSSWCLVVVVWLFRTMPWVCLQFVIVVLADHTHLLFFIGYCKSKTDKPRKEMGGLHQNS